jgi:outer membrane protein OmpA-like peptidoglycan-associated protein
MKGMIMLGAPLLIAACSATVREPPAATPDVAQTWSTTPSSTTPTPTDTSTILSAKVETSPASTSVHEEQSKAPTPPAVTAGADDNPAQVFPDRRSVEAMDRLAVSIPVRHTSRGDQVTLASDDTFEPGSATPTLSARWRLEDIATALAAQSNRKIRVEVYADSLGDAAERDRISQLRADVLRDYFVSHGSRADAIEARGLGSSHPLASNLTAEGRRTNRRVEIIVEPKGH